MGITQPGGAGTIIYLYDDSINAGGFDPHTAGQPHTFAEIAQFCVNAGNTDFVSNGTNKPSYRGSVNVQIGDAGTGTATTTLEDTVESTVIWDNTRTLAYRATQTSSWFTNLGTKVGTGDQATGHKGTTLVFGATTTLRGTMNFYGCDIRVQGNFICTVTPYAVGVGELVNCIFQSASTSAAVSGFSIGLNAFDNIYNVDVTAGVSVDVLNIFGGNSVERITVGGPSLRSAFQLSAGTSRSYKDVSLFGSPTRADILWSASTIVNHHLIRPVWTNNAPKFGFASASASTPTLANATLEYWPYNVKIVDGAGDAISGIPVRLTDAVGNIQVDTTTGADGRLSYGSGLTANTAVVMDHYSNGTIYVQRHRGTFLCEINTGPGSNTSYLSKTYTFTWPGAETVTVDSGTFEPVQDIIPLALNDYISVDELPLEAEHVTRIYAEVP